MDEPIITGLAPAQLAALAADTWIDAGEPEPAPQIPQNGDVADSSLDDLKHLLDRVLIELGQQTIETLRSAVIDVREFGAHHLFVCVPRPTAGGVAQRRVVSDCQKGVGCLVEEPRSTPVENQNCGA